MTDIFVCWLLATTYLLIYCVIGGGMFVCGIVLYIYLCMLSYAR